MIEANVLYSHIIYGPGSNAAHCYGVELVADVARCRGVYLKVAYPDVTRSRIDPYDACSHATLVADEFQHSSWPRALNLHVRAMNRERREAAMCVKWPAG